MLRYLRQREIVHYQRFAEGLELLKARLDEKNYYAFNPSMPLGAGCASAAKGC